VKTVSMRKYLCSVIPYTYWSIQQGHREGTCELEIILSRNPILGWKITNVYYNSEYDTCYIYLTFHNLSLYYTTRDQSEILVMIVNLLRIIRQFSHCKIIFTQSSNLSYDFDKWFNIGWGDFDWSENHTLKCE